MLSFVDDRATLDGASKDELRVRFKGWAAEAIVTENPRAEQNRNPDVPRYRYLVQFDGEVSRNVVTEPVLDPSGGGYFDRGFSMEASE